MQLWKRLYNTIWLAFFACVLVPRWMGEILGLPVHALLGLLLLVMTLTNARKLAALSVPDRLKRISKVTVGFAVFQLVTGLALGALHHLTPNLPYVASIIQGMHVVIALAILAQTASVATAYDMWEEKEFQE
jgi:fatty acid desaturase